MDLDQIRAQYPQYDDLSDMELARALHSRFYSDMDFNDFAGRIGVMVGPEPSAPIPEGTALGDFIATFGNAAALGIPRRLSSSLDERLDFLEENNPGTSALVGLGGAGLTGGAALRGGANILARGTARQAANPHGLNIVHQAGPGLARSAGRGLLELVKSRAGAGGGGFAAGALLDRLLN